jgi:hypothetical protein
MPLLFVCLRSTARFAEAGTRAKRVAEVANAGMVEVVLLPDGMVDLVGTTTRGAEEK